MTKESLMMISIHILTKYLMKSPKMEKMRVEKPQIKDSQELFMSRA